uniref:Reverse transcriptase domain-containing protein n=1 Tax=Tanacetum cinerariifolium TaxID=118510 RepID=A0A6L2M1X7_TANCI|nr:reverse transcriptase domain-containing protein [Tanacetum cinerariifolium]
MANKRTLAELLRTSTEGYAEAIVLPLILAEQFELKHSLINMMTSDQFFGLEKDNPHDHIRWFNKITSTIKYKDVPNSATKLMLFPFSLTGAARRWLEKEPPRSILTWEELVFKLINEFFPPSRTTNLRNEISNFQKRFDESFHEAWDRYKDLLRTCPRYGFTELHQLDTFYNALNPTDHDSINAATGGNLLEGRTQDVLTIIENKSKVRNSRNKLVVSQVKSCDANSNSSSEVAKLTYAVNQQTSAVTTSMTAILKQFQATPPPASVKSVDKICVTCGGAHPYYQCLITGGNTFPELRDNIQEYVAAAAITYNQGNSVYRPPGMANQIQPSGFGQPNAQNNQNWFSQPQGYNRGNNFNPEQSYQTPTQQNQVVPLNELEKVKRMNEANMKGMQTQINNVKNKLRNEMKNSIQVSLSNQTNEIKNMMASLFQMNTASTSGSGSLPSNTVANSKGELNPSPLEVVLFLMDLPFLLLPHSLIRSSPFQKEKLQELANTTLNENCSAVILKKLLEKLRDPRKFLIPCGFSKLKCKALADLAGIARDVFVPDGKFTFPADFVIVDYESDPRVPLIIGRPFLQTARALIDVHGEEMILRDGDERLTLNMRHDTSSYSNQPQKESISQVSSSLNPLLEEFADELALITFPLEYDDDLQFDIESDLKEKKYLLHHDPIKDIDSILKDSIDQTNLNNNLVDSIPEMFTDEHALDYSSPPLFDEYEDDIFEVESDTKNVYDDPFDSKGEKIKKSKLLIDELDLLFEFLLPSNKKLAISNASLMIEDFDPPLYELPFFKEVPWSNMLLLFSSENEEKVFKPGIHTSEKVHSTLITELSHQGYKIFKINQIFKSPMKIFLFSY